MIGIKRKWSRYWKSSKQPRKQRKYRARSPLHIRHKLLAAHLSKELRTRYGRRSFPVRVGDDVRIMRGEHAGKVGKISRVDKAALKVYIKELKRKKISGREVEIPIHPSNLLLVALKEDKKREKALRRAIKQTGDRT